MRCIHQSLTGTFCPTQPPQPNQDVLDGSANLNVQEGHIAVVMDLVQPGCPGRIHRPRCPGRLACFVHMVSFPPHHLDLEHNQDVLDVLTNLDVQEGLFVWQVFSSWGFTHCCLSTF